MAAGLAGDLAGLDAGRADAEATAGAARGGPDDLDVRVPAARRAAMGVGDVVTESRPLAADLADSRHGMLPCMNSDDGRCTRAQAPRVGESGRTCSAAAVPRAAPRITDHLPGRRISAAAENLACVAGC